jgi:hypothetical protein
MHARIRPPSARWLRAATIALLVAAAACEQPSAPASARLDTTATLADYQALQELFASEGFAGVQSLGGRTPMSANTALAAARALPALAGGDGARTGRQYALDLFRAATSQASGLRRSTFAKTIISDRHLGRTLVYDAAQDQYVIDPSRTGAPSNGVRFIVYELDGRGKPIPSREIGRADLIDEGANTGEAIALRLLVVTRGSTRLDYRTRVDVGNGTGAIDVSGFAADGAERLDFNVKLRGRTTGGATIVDADFDFSVQPRNFSVTGQVRGVQDGRDGVGSVALTARHQSNTLRVTLSGDNGMVNGGITWNGTPYISISGPAANPDLRGPTGQPLTPQEVLVVQSVMRLSDDVFDLVEELVEPVEGLVLLGWLL